MLSKITRVVWKASFPGSRGGNPPVEVIRTTSHMRELSRKWKLEGNTIGLVPTMGALHRGHISLVERSLNSADRTVVSIFVNPVQFDEEEDLDGYPRMAERDCEILRTSGVHAVFMPSEDEIYPEGYSTYIGVEGITDTLCGEHRRGHFRGVTTVCLLLFHTIEPDLAVFGQKDAQQLAVIRRMVIDLRLELEIVAVPIVRESDGLAMSSRNRYLSPQLRVEATAIFRGLCAVAESARKGILDSGPLIRSFSEVISTSPNLAVQYARLVDPESMQDIESVTGRSLFAVAVFAGRTRLIDNILLEPGCCSMEV